RQPRHLAGAAGDPPQPPGQARQAPRLPKRLGNRLSEAETAAAQQFVAFTAQPPRFLPVLLGQARERVALQPQPPAVVWRLPGWPRIGHGRSTGAGLSARTPPCRPAAPTPAA